MVDHFGVKNSTAVNTGNITHRIHGTGIFTYIRYLVDFYGKLVGKFAIVGSYGVINAIVFWCTTNLASFFKCHPFWLGGSEVIKLH